MNVGFCTNFTLFLGAAYERISSFVEKQVDPVFVNEILSYQPLGMDMGWNTTNFKSKRKKFNSFFLCGCDVRQFRMMWGKTHIRVQAIVVFEFGT